ncbi:hypothetical protein [Streptomyces sp. NPDC002588]|uniref:hypothetical protein n=1 Tax=Streptomyces sp. NPDC002588 TaxID=3154419 RepID=UPI00332A17A5
MDPLPGQGMVEVTVQSCVEPLARRRRHAWLLATLTELIGDCAQAAGEVYRSLAEAPPTRSDVPVNLGVLAGLYQSASSRVDTARAQDAARRPSSVTREKEEDERTFAARCATTEAERVLVQAEDEDTKAPEPPRMIPSQTLTQCAAIALEDAGADFLTELLDDPVQAVKRAQELASTGEFTVDQIIDEASDTAVLCGLLSLHEAQRETDPSTAAATCLTATRHFALAVTVVSIDVPAATP